MNRKNLLLSIVGIILIITAVWQILAAQHGLEIITLHTSSPPVTIITPKGTTLGSRPTVLIAHGFAGSGVIMRGFALTLAHAGYTTVLWDFNGHGSNPNPFDFNLQSNGLVQNAEAALTDAETTGLVDPNRIAILGHSMGSGVALTYGVDHPETAATIAVSPVNQTITPDLPHNLLLMAGSLESQFVSNAEQLLNQAGGQGGNPAMGTARELFVVPNVEHISILFSPTAHSTARSWLDETFGSQPGATSYTDRRVVWFGIGILGFVILSNAILNIIPSANQTSLRSKPGWLRIITLIGGSIASSLILWLVSLSGVQINQMLGLVVGGYLLVWFGIAGIVGLVILRPHIPRPSPRDLLIGIIAFAALWLGVGLLGQFIWLPWLLIPERLWLWIPGAIILLPWSFIVAEVAHPATRLGQVGWWLYHSVVVIAGLYLAMMVNPELGFIFIILPLFPIILGLHVLMSCPRRGVWSFALSGALFISWLLLAVFPLQ
jgi:pimeloyl-ACP methyl ester carboxylesterase